MNFRFSYWMAACLAVSCSPSHEDLGKTASGREGSDGAADAPAEDATRTEADAAPSENSAADADDSSALPSVSRDGEVDGRNDPGDAAIYDAGHTVDAGAGDAALTDARVADATDSQADAGRRDANADGGSTCPTSPPVAGTPCVVRTDSCYYEDCATYGRAGAYCQTGQWEVIGQACREAWCATAAVYQTCAQGEMCIVTTGKTITARCQPLTCTGLITCECTGTCGCYMSGSTSGLTAHCNECPDGGICR